MTGAGIRRVLVLGGGYAGMVAAGRVAAGARDTEVTLVDARRAFVQRVRLHELLAGRSPAELDYAAILPRAGVRFEQARVERIDAGRQAVTISGAGGGGGVLHYDALVLALGSRTAARVPGVADHTLRLNEPAKIRRASERLEGMPPGARLIVVGGGMTAIETATELAERYPHMRMMMIVHGGVGAAFSRHGEAHLRARFDRLRIELREGVRVVEVRSRELQLDDGSVLPFELCVWAGGFEASPLARESGLPVLPDGRTLVDASLRVVGHENIFAAGDAAAVRVDSDVLGMGCVSAGPLGAHAGDNVIRALRGTRLESFAFGYFVRCISLGRTDGLVQFTRRNGAPVSTVVRRRSAAALKELVCRLALLNVQLETRGVRATWWPRPRPSVQLSSEPSEVSRLG